MGFLGSTVVVYLINQLRILSLYFALARHGEWFVPLHAYTFPARFIALGLIYVTRWLARHPFASSDRVAPAAA